MDKPTKQEWPCHAISCVLTEPHDEHENEDGVTWCTNAPSIKRSDVAAELAGMASRFQNALAMATAALERIKALKCRCDRGYPGSCGCGDRAREIADEALDATAAASAGCNCDNVRHFGVHLRECPAWRGGE